MVLAPPKFLPHQFVGRYYPYKARGGRPRGGGTVAGVGKPIWILPSRAPYPPITRPRPKLLRSPGKLGGIGGSAGKAFILLLQLSIEDSWSSIASSAAVIALKSQRSVQSRAKPPLEMTAAQNSATALFIRCSRISFNGLCNWMCWPFAIGRKSRAWIVSAASDSAKAALVVRFITVFTRSPMLRHAKLCKLKNYITS